MTMMEPHDSTRREFLAAGAAAAASLAAGGTACARAPAQKFHVKALPGERGNAQPASIPWNAQGYRYNMPVRHPVKVA